MNATLYRRRLELVMAQEVTGNAKRTWLVTYTMPDGSKPTAELSDEYFKRHFEPMPEDGQ